MKIAGWRRLIHLAQEENVFVYFYISLFTFFFQLIFFVNPFIFGTITFIKIDVNFAIFSPSVSRDLWRNCLFVFCAATMEYKSFDLLSLQLWFSKWCVIRFISYINFLVDDLDSFKINKTLYHSTNNYLFRLNSIIYDICKLD